MVVNIDFYRLIDKIDALIKNYGSLSIYRTVRFSIEQVGLYNTCCVWYSFVTWYAVLTDRQCFQAYFRRWYILAGPGTWFERQFSSAAVFISWP